MWETTSGIALGTGVHILKVDYFEQGGAVRVYLGWISKYPLFLPIVRC